MSGLGFAGAFGRRLPRHLPPNEALSICPNGSRGWTHITLRLYGGVLLKGGGGAEIAALVSLFFKCFYCSVVECQSCKLKVLGSVPIGGSCASNQQSYPFYIARLLPAELIPLQHLSVPTDMPKSLPALPYPMRKDSLAERSKAVAQGAIPRGRGLKLTAFIFLPLLTCSLEVSIGNFILQLYREALQPLGHDDCRWRA